MKYKTLSDFSEKFQNKVQKLLPKWDPKGTTETRITKLIRCKSLAKERNQPHGHVGWAVQVLDLNCNEPPEKRVLKSSTIYVDKNGKLIK